MEGFKRKTRMLAFRLSEEEYQSIRRASIATGARSVSEYARESIVRANGDAPCDYPEALRSRVDELAAGLDSVNRDLRRLQARLDDGSPASE